MILALTEIIEGLEHYFVVEAGTPLGAEILLQVPHRPRRNAEVEKAEHIHAKTAQQMGRTMDTADIKELLYANMEHPRWEAVASRCLSCGNCTMVCPTCFCTTVEDVTDLKGDHAERWQKWDSCFTMDFSYIHGGSIRSSTKSRYRQWMTHKLATLDRPVRKFRMCRVRTLYYLVPSGDRYHGGGPRDSGNGPSGGQPGEGD